MSQHWRVAIYSPDLDSYVVAGPVFDNRELAAAWQDCLCVPGPTRLVQYTREDRDELADWERAGLDRAHVGFGRWLVVTGRVSDECEEGVAVG